MCRLEDGVCFLLLPVVAPPPIFGLTCVAMSGEIATAIPLMSDLALSPSDLRADDTSERLDMECYAEFVSMWFAGVCPLTYFVVF